MRHAPHYRAAHSQNLKRDFPRLPFYPAFRAWAEAGQQLLTLHLTYETAEPADADLLARVVTVSVRTMEIVDALAAQSPLRPEA